MDTVFGSKRFACNKIQTRGELAKELGLSRATVYRVFDADWSGRHDRHGNAGHYTDCVGTNTEYTRVYAAVLPGPAGTPRRSSPRAERNECGVAAVSQQQDQNTMRPSDLSEYLDDDPSGKLMVNDLANRYGWIGGAVWRNADDVVARLVRPNGLAIDLVWNGDTLVRAVRDTRAGKIQVKGNGFTGPAMLKIVAGWLEDTE